MSATPMQETIPQGSLVWPREPIAIGRIRAHCGQSFWVTNSQLSQELNKVIQIARSGRNAGHAIGVTLADFTRFFTTRAQ